LANLPWFSHSFYCFVLFIKLHNDLSSAKERLEKADQIQERLQKLIEEQKFAQNKIKTELAQVSQSRAPLSARIKTLEKAVNEDYVKDLEETSSLMESNNLDLIGQITIIQIDLNNVTTSVYAQLHSLQDMVTITTTAQVSMEQTLSQQLYSLQQTLDSVQKNQQKIDASLVQLTAVSSVQDTKAEEIRSNVKNLESSLSAKLIEQEELYVMQVELAAIRKDVNDIRKQLSKPGIEKPISKTQTGKPKEKPSDKIVDDPHAKEPKEKPLDKIVDDPHAKEPKEKPLDQTVDNLHAKEPKEKPLDQTGGDEKEQTGNEEQTGSEGDQTSDEEQTGGNEKDQTGDEGDLTVEGDPSYGEKTSQNKAKP